MHAHCEHVSAVSGEPGPRARGSMCEGGVDLLSRKPTRSSSSIAMAHQLLQRYQPGGETPETARHDVAAYLIDVGHSELSPVAELLTSELVTSSLVHAKGVVMLRAMWTGERLHVEVSDHGGARPMPWDPEMPGRGLRTVCVLAADWGVRRLDDGRASWFDLDGT